MGPRGAHLSTEATTGTLSSHTHGLLADHRDVSAAMLTRIGQLADRALHVGPVREAIRLNEQVLEELGDSASAGVLIDRLNAHVQAWRQLLRLLPDWVRADPIIQIMALQYEQTTERVAEVLDGFPAPQEGPRTRMTMSKRSFVLAAGHVPEKLIDAPREMPSFDDLIRGSRPADLEYEAAPPRRRSRPVLRFFGVLLVVVGVAGGTASALFPDQLEWFYGEAKGTVQQASDGLKNQDFNDRVADLVGSDGRIDVESLSTEQQEQFRDAAEESFPAVELGVHGGKPELDWCDGTFTVMDAYESDGGGDVARRIPATGAAHNNCGGDVLLTWEVGQRVNVAGQGYDGLYEVVEIRLTSKIWSSTADLEGLAGDIALQSCFYGVDQMKFVGLQRIAEI